MILNTLILQIIIEWIKVVKYECAFDSEVIVLVRFDDMFISNSVHKMGRRALTNDKSKHYKNITYNQTE